MASYKLQQGETLYASLESIRMDTEDALFPETGDLVLTDRRLVWVEKGIFGKVKSERGFSLSDITVSHGRARVDLKRDPGGSYALDVFLPGRKLSFSTSEKDLRSAVSFANELNHVVTGTLADIYRMKKTGLIQDGVNMFKESLGLDPDLIEELSVYEPVPVPGPGAPARSEDGRQGGGTAPRKASGKCGFCGAPLKAAVGKTVRCPYCGGEQMWGT